MCRLDYILILSLVFVACENSFESVWDSLSSLYSGRAVKAQSSIESRQTYEANFGKIEEESKGELEDFSIVLYFVYNGHKPLYFHFLCIFLYV